MTSEGIQKFRGYLREGEKSENTIGKYIRDVTVFWEVCNGEITKDTVIAYKQSLINDGYAILSVNFVLAN